MVAYNLAAMGPADFQRLCQALLVKIIGPGVKAYGPGPDGGRDASFVGEAAFPSKSEPWRGAWIFQVKHYDTNLRGLSGSRSALLQDIKTELEKVKSSGARVNNFVLMTNVPLTPVLQKGTKDRAAALLQKHGAHVPNKDVLGAEDISAMLDAHPDVRQTFSHLVTPGDLIGKLLWGQSQPGELEETIKMYCQACFVHEESAVLDDAGDVDDRPVPLQDVFVDLEVRALPPPPPPLNAEDQVPQWLRQATANEKRTSALSFLLDDSVPSVVVLGGPGDGKSTLGQYIAQMYRAQLLGRLEDLGSEADCCRASIPRIPFRIALRELAQWMVGRNEGTLYAFIAENINRTTSKALAPAQVHQIFKTNSTLLILDGLDEVADKDQRSRLLAEIGAFVDQVRFVYKQSIKVVATSRPYSYSDEFNPQRYLHIGIRRMERTRAKEYAVKWINAREHDPRNADRIHTVFDTCLNDKVVSLITQSPLQVTILLVIIRARGTPPKQREELFERYMDIIYSREQKNRPELLRTEADVIYGLHKYIGYVLHKRAEKDRSAALMDSAEFERHIAIYLQHINPLFKPSEVRSRTTQIMNEASQRLVLIESPIAGKYGFGLTSTREFFAAAHLVDTARNTTERDARLKAILLSPHWHNSALFFAGRVGRTRPGEAPSMVDVCRETDTGPTDQFLRRGASFVLEMVEDRAIRESHNELGAVQYGLSYLEAAYVKDLDGVAKRIADFDTKYISNIVRPYLSKQLETNQAILRSLGYVYNQVLGVDEALILAVRKAGASDPDAARWAIELLAQKRIAEPWIAEILNQYPREALAFVRHRFVGGVRAFVNLPLNDDALWEVSSAFASPYRISEEPRSVHVDGLDIHAKGWRGRNARVVWLLSQLDDMARQSRLQGRYPTSKIKFVLRPPYMVTKSGREFAERNGSALRQVASDLAKADLGSPAVLLGLLADVLSRPSERALVALVSHSADASYDSNFWKTRYVVRNMVGETRGIRPATYANGVREVLSSRYGAEEIAARLEKVVFDPVAAKPGHQVAAYMWLYAGCPRSVEKYVDPTWLAKLDRALESMALTRKVLSCFTPLLSTSDVVKVDRNRRIFLDLTAKLLPLTVPLSHAWILEGFPASTKEGDPRLGRAYADLMPLLKPIESHRELAEALIMGAFANGFIPKADALEHAYAAAGHEEFPFVTWHLQNVKGCDGLLLSLAESRNDTTASIALLTLRRLNRYSGPHDRVKHAHSLAMRSMKLLKKGRISPSQALDIVSVCSVNWSEISLKQVRKIALKQPKIEFAAFLGEVGCAAGSELELRNQLLVLAKEPRLPGPVRKAAFARLYEIQSKIDLALENERDLGLPLQGPSIGS